MFNRSLYLTASEELRRNPGQSAAFDATGHCVVLAGPGSGKTKTLTIKLARMLSEDVEEPRGVACITYNNDCARELENRLDKLGIDSGNRLFVGTVHSFSLTQIILPYAKSARLELPDDFTIATRSQRATALANAYRRTIAGPDDPDKWNFGMSNYRRSILNRESAEWRTRNPEMAALVEAYEAELRALGCIDFDDMPLLAVQALRKNPWLQRALLAKYPVLAVDEYQDLGEALHRIVMGLCFSTGMRLFAVGDIDQSIYGFTGARPELLEQLCEREDVDVVRLRLNYRSGSNIVAASAYALGEHRDYEAVEGAGEGTIYFHPQPGQYQAHAQYVFSTLLPEIIARAPALNLSDVAILYPAAWIGNAVAEAAQANGFQIVRTDGNALYPRASRLMRWFELCASWCCGGWKSGMPRFARISREGCGLFREALSTREEAEAFGRSLMSALWRRREPSASIHEWLAGLNTELVEGLIGTCRSLSEERTHLSAFLDRTESGGDSERMTLRQFSGQGEGNNSVNLSTLHSAKGREFEVAIMFVMDNGQVPPAVAGPALIESRRLFYVGFTRAKSEVHMVYSANRPSPFVLEVQRRLKSS